jgi:uncharacterized protein YecE (DUF72 family)
MVTSLPLFDEPPAFDRERLAGSLRALARENIFIGGSSWKYEGWLGQVYDRSNYLVRGKLSKRLFEDTCLKEYAETFPAVCGDFSFYQFPTDSFWRRLFSLVPEGFRFAFKVPEQITCRTFPARALRPAGRSRERDVPEYGRLPRDVPQAAAAESQEGGPAHLRVRHLFQTQLRRIG